MKKLIFCVSLALAGLMTGCVEKNEPVDADEKPSWLGGSIYQELKNPDPSRLTGTFQTYLRLVDDLGLAETLDRTGSKTVFPANDEAFQRFFQSNDWGVRSYEQLSDAQKKLLVYNSMLDNALLVGMLSNMSNTSNGENSVVKGMAMKHQTNVSVIDTIQYITNGADMPQNNPYWDKYRESGIHVVSDATRPMMVHFTREHMLQNGITTMGDESDFAIITGTPYTEGTVYVFDNGIKKNDVTGELNSDRTCLNGYIHQMENVIVPPGNLAQVLRRTDDTKFFSRFLDYFSAPYYSATVTNNYNAWAIQNGREQIDSIFEVRYMNTQTGHSLNLDPDNNLVSGSRLLGYDPGWNQYSPQQSSGGVEYAIGDIGTIFAPTDQAWKDFFLQGGPGAYLIDIYGKYTGADNNEAHLAENLDSLHSKRPDILTTFVKNLMKASFTGNVPSKFSTIQNDAADNMGMKLSLLQKTADGRYDIQIANNGIIYKLSEVVAPDEFQSVMAPSSTYADMQVMNWAVKEPDSQNKLNIDFRYYLMAMSANYAFFVPDDAAFDRFYVDPTSLGHAQPNALRFYYDTSRTPITLHCDRYAYDPQTNEVGARIGEASISQVKSMLIDIMNYHTVVLEKGQTVGSNHYYKTKHGGEIYVEAGTTGTRVMSGQQLDNGMEPSVIQNVYPEKNGNTYRIDHVIEPPRNSVYKTLTQYSQFSEFMSVCNGFDNSDLLSWAGISDAVNAFGISPQDAYVIFGNNNKNAYPSSATDAQKVQPNCLDFNVKMFNTYNYTLYVPNNEAMEKAYQAGLPRWSDIQLMYLSALESGTLDDEDAKAKAYQMIRTLRDFTRYHFQRSSVYADNTVDGGTFNSLSTDELGIAIEISVSGGNGRLEVKDAAGQTHVVDANNTARVSNKMARDYWFTGARSTATEIYTSSFCAIHELTDPLFVYSTTRYDGAWSSRQARERSLATYKRLKKENKL